MLSWTNKAVEVLRDASTKADHMNHSEVHPLHLMWALTGKTGMDALRYGNSDRRQARIRFQVEKDLNRLPAAKTRDAVDWGECATPGFRLQQLLLRAADISARSNLGGERGRVGLNELLKALLADDHRAASLLRARQEGPVATV